MFLFVIPLRVDYLSLVNVSGWHREQEHTLARLHSGPHLELVEHEFDKYISNLNLLSS